jgi:hypothetical protein
VLAYDGAAVARGRRRAGAEPCALQPRDLALIDNVRRCKFLTTPQLLELWWPGAAPQVGRRRLTRLFEMGYLERFRPVARRGSFPWTYQLGREGHRLLQRTGVLPAGERFETVEVYDYRYVLHHIHLSSWVLAWRRLLAGRLLEWDGERNIEPHGRGELAAAEGLDAVVGGLKDPRPRTLRPDAILEVAGHDAASPNVFLVEYDRTRRVDKNFDKFLRYDAFATSWWRRSEFGAGERLPWIVFVCQSAAQRDLFVRSADRQVTGRVRVAGCDRFPGRMRILFASEPDMHAGDPLAVRLPEAPPDHPDRAQRGAAVGVRLPHRAQPR